MVLEPLTCPVQSCPKPEFLATSSATLKRHFRRYHRDEYPNPEFSFRCPVAGCDFVNTNKNAVNIWRHTKNVHPDVPLPGSHPMDKSSSEEAALAATGITGEASTASTTVAVQPVERPEEEQIRVEAVQDVRNSYFETFSFFFTSKFQNL